MVKNTQESIKKAVAAASNARISTINTEKLFNQQPTFYNFNKVFS